MVSEAIVGIVAMALLFGAVPAIILVGIIMSLKNRRHKVEEQSKLIAMMIEKGESANLDFKAMVEALNETGNKQKTKKSVLKQLNSGVFLSVLGLFILVVGLILDKGVEPIVAGSGLLTAGVTFVIMFFVSKNYLKKEIESEEKQLNEK
jgi:small-conductance mechanosensitive channel